MKKTMISWALMAVAVVMMTACASKSETADANNFRIKRGTNISHWMSQ
jgi:endoglucanase